MRETAEGSHPTPPPPRRRNNAAKSAIGTAVRLLTSICFCAAAPSSQKPAQRSRSRACALEQVGPCLSRSPRRVSPATRGLARVAGDQAWPFRSTPESDRFCWPLAWSRRSSLTRWRRPFRPDSRKSWSPPVLQPHRDGFCAGWAPVRLPAGRAVARDRERHAAADAVCVRDRQCVRGARAAGRGIRPELRVQSIRVRLLHRHDTDDSQPGEPLHGQWRRRRRGQRVRAPGAANAVGDQSQRRRDALRPGRQAVRRAWAKTPSVRTLRR